MAIRSRKSPERKPHQLKKLVQQLHEPRDRDEAARQIALRAYDGNKPAFRALIQTAGAAACQNRCDR